MHSQPPLRSAAPGSIRNPRLGFTLMELIIVIALVSIMTAMIIPELRGTYEETLLRSTSRELINVCAIAHSRAASLNQPHRVRIDPASGKFQIERRVRSRGASEFLPVRGVAGAQGELDSRIAVRIRDAGKMPERDQASSREPEAEAEPVITFFSDGTADAKEVLLQDRQGFRLLLRLNPVTSRIRVVETSATEPPP